MGAGGDAEAVRTLKIILNFTHCLSGFIIRHDGLRRTVVLLVAALLAALCSSVSAASLDLPLHQYGWGVVKTVVLSRDGKRLLTSGYDGAAHLWDVTTGQHLRAFAIPSASLPTSLNVGYPVQELSLSADGAIVNTTICASLTWDATNGQVLNATGQGFLSPDGTKLLSRSKLIDVTTGSVIWTMPADYYVIIALSFSADGKRFVTYGEAQDGFKVAQWDIATGQRMLEFALSDDIYDFFNSYPTLDQKLFNGVALTRDGAKVMTRHKDYILRLWDAKSGVLMGEFAGQPDPVVTISLSDDGARALTYGVTNPDYWDNGMPAYEAYHSVWMWDIVTSQTLKVFSHAGETPRGATFVGNRPLIVSTTADQTVHLWDLETDQLVQTFTGHTPAVQNLELSKDGTKLLTYGSDLKMRMWDAASEQLLWTKSGWGRFTPDSQKVLCAVQTAPNAQILDAASGNTLTTKSGPAGSLGIITFSGDGTKMLVNCADGQVRLWDMTAMQTLGALAPDPNGRWGWSLSYDGMSALARNYSYATAWDLRSNALHLLRGMTPGDNVPDYDLGAIVSTTLSPDGALAILNESQDMRADELTAVTLWNTKNGAQLTRYTDFEMIDGAYQGAVFSPTGRMGLMIGGSGVDQFTIRTARPMKSLWCGHLDLYAAAFSADEAKIVTGGADGVARLWNAADIKAAAHDWTRYK